MRNPYWNGKIALSDRPTNPGERNARIFEPIFDGSTTVLRQTGTKDIQAAMDALAPYCDIRYMLNQLKVGDTSVLSDKPALYGDFTGLPSNPADVINLVTGAQSAFGTLSPSDRAKYNNDWRLWFADAMQPKPEAVQVPDSAPAESVSA
nr:virion structural protein [Microvirus sp.]